jgi:uncharacterized protein (DUF736 family)
MFASVLQSRLRWPALIVLVLVIYSLYGNFGERQNRREVLAGGRQAIARVERSTGLQSVMFGWIDANGQTRTGEAWTRKQGDGRQFVGKRVAIQYVDDPSVMPVILSEVAEREWANEFQLYWNPLITIVLFGATIGFVAWVGSRA